MQLKNGLFDLCACVLPHERLHTQSERFYLFSPSYHSSAQYRHSSLSHFICSSSFVHRPSAITSVFVVFLLLALWATHLFIKIEIVHIPGCMQHAVDDAILHRRYTLILKQKVVCVWVLCVVSGEFISFHLHRPGLSCVNEWERQTWHSKWRNKSFSTVKYWNRNEAKEKFIQKKARKKEKKRRNRCLVHFKKCISVSAICSRIVVRVRVAAYSSLDLCVNASREQMRQSLHRRGRTKR